MSYEHEARKWLAVLKDNRIWEQDDVLPLLRLSYDHLPSNMKQCFAFCAVYPKDYEMDKEKLIQFWMAHGFIPSDGLCSLEMKGNDIFNELIWRSFFQEVRHVKIDEYGYQMREYGRIEEYHWKTKCKMHDLMHDLAQSIMGAKCLSTSKVPAQLNHPMINVYHISLRTLPVDINKVIDCFPSIRSLIWSKDCYVTNYMKKIEFLKSNSLRLLELLRVGTIWKTIITPEKMKHLRYLEFSMDKITSLPEAISTLYLLQTLRLLRCYKLEKLPKGMRYMSSLRHLDIKYCCNLRSMPEGLGQLNCLQILTTYIIGTDVGNGIRELNNLNNLHGQLHLYNIGKIKHIIDATEANLISKQNLDDLALCWGIPKHYRRVDPNLQKSNAPEVHCYHFEVLDALKPSNKLKVLKIEEYRGDKLPVWMTEYQMLENLIELYIIECSECPEVPPVEKLPFLQVLKLKRLDNLRNLCNSASTSVKGDEDDQVTFPSLENMELFGMRELCSWCKGEVGNKSSLIFPKLKTLEVIYCPKLAAMPIVPSLMRMTVKGNKSLSCFATGLTTLDYLSLESHGENESLSFQPWESLNELTLSKYNSIVPVAVKEGEVSITKCRMLMLWGMTNIPSNTSLWFWKCFTFLDNLFISECDSLIYWPVKEFSSLNCLTHIQVQDCPNFLGSQQELPVGSSITEMVLPLLLQLGLFRCPNLVEIPKCSTSIQILTIGECSKLQCLPEWLGSMVALKFFRIANCESLNSLIQSIGVLACLEKLKIVGCPNLAYLPEGMEGLKALQELEIQECPKIRVLPEGLLQQLKNLNHLWIEGCPRLERHFGKFGKYRRLISEIQITKFGEERRFNILKDLALSFPSCKITCFLART